MNDTYVTDEEQAEKLRQWWSENGWYILTGVALGLAILFGWNYWQKHTESKAESGAQHYTQLVSAVNASQYGQIDEMQSRLVDGFSSTPYAALGALSVARAMVEQNQLEPAAEKLQWVIDNASQQELQNVAAIRLAQVFIAQGKNEEALAILERDLPPSYTALREEYRGDAYRGQNDLVKAREAYDKALISSPQSSEYLQLKRDNLGSAEEENS